MHDKLELLLKLISFPKEFYNFFYNGKLLAIEHSKKTNRTTFALEIDKILPIQMYDKLRELIDLKYPTAENCLLISVRNPEFDGLPVYFKYFRDELKSLDLDFAECLEKSTVSFYGDLIKIAPTYAVMDETFEDLKDNISIRLEQAGFFDVKVISSEQLIVEETKEEEMNDEPETCQVLGYPFNGMPKQICDIHSEENQVIFEVELFGVDARKTRNTNLVALKMTDGTDSMDAVIYERDLKEWNKIQKQIKKHKHFKVRGRVQIDKYRGELSMVINDMFGIEKEEDRKSVV